MKKGIHPNYVECEVSCSCGSKFITGSVRPKIHVDICSQCHPFYTGNMKFVDAAGRIEKFQKKYNWAGSPGGAGAAAGIAAAAAVPAAAK